MPTRRALLAATAFALPLTARAEDGCCGPLSPGALRMIHFLDTSGIEQLWLPGWKVEWDTGRAISQFATKSRHTHCSAFAASMAMRLGVYLLRPPEHSPSLLANAQMRWLRSDAGAAAGWQPLADAIAAQTAANAGKMVVAVYENPNPANPGHIAIVRPGEVDRETLIAQGPYETQAGMHNWIKVPTAAGFAREWKSGHVADIRYFAHDVDWASVQA